MEKVKNFFNSPYADYVFWIVVGALIITGPAVVAIPAGIYTTVYALAKF